MRSTQLSTRTLLWRGLTKRCPHCGQGQLFRRWLTMVEGCPRCGLRFERVEGHWIGAIGINTVVTLGAVLTTLVVGVVATAPDIAVGPLTALSVAFSIVLPIVFYPFSKTIWTAIDIRMRPVEPDEVYPGFWS